MAQTKAMNDFLAIHRKAAAAERRDHQRQAAAAATSPNGSYGPETQIVPLVPNQSRNRCNAHFETVRNYFAAAYLNTSMIGVALATGRCK